MMDRLGIGMIAACVARGAGVAMTRELRTRQRLLRWVLQAQLETERERFGCHVPDCGVCRRRRARVDTLERRLSRVLLCSVAPADVRAGVVWARMLLSGECEQITQELLEPIRLPASRYLIDRGYMLQESDGRYYAWKDTRR